MRTTRWIKCRHCRCVNPAPVIAAHSHKHRPLPPSKELSQLWRPRGNVGSSRRHPLKSTSKSSSYRGFRKHQGHRSMELLVVGGLEAQNPLGVVMSIAEDRPDVPSRTTGRSGPRVFIWREASLGKISIAACAPVQNVVDVQHFVSIELALPEPEHTEPQHSDEPLQKSSYFGDRVSVNVSMELLLEANMSSGLKISGITLTDSIAFELSIGIVESCSLRNINAYTKSCMVKMLCAQIIESASSSMGLPRCRSTGLADWQRATLETALAEGNKDDISLEAFATRCGLSVCQFSRLFRATYGLPFHQHIVERKILRACSLLLLTQDSISQIALDCGFSDQSSFTRRFSAKIGKSPASWRRGRPLESVNPSHMAEWLMTQ